MALVPLRITRTTKPPLGTPIDWSNPLAQGLVGAWAFNEGGGAPVDSVSAKRLTCSTVPAYSAGDIVRIQNTDTIYATFANLSISECTVITCIRQTTNINTAIFAGFYGSVVGQQFMVRRSYSNYPILSSSNADRITGSTNLSVINTFYTHVITNSVKANQQTMFCNGVLQGVATFSYNSLAYDTFQPAGCNSGSITGWGWNGFTKYTYLYNRALSAAEIASISANPWQLYEPETLWVDLGGGGNIWNASILESVLYIDSFSNTAMENCLYVDSFNLSDTVNNTANIYSIVQELHNVIDLYSMTSSIQGLILESNSVLDNAVALLSGISALQQELFGINDNYSNTQLHNLLVNEILSVLDYLIVLQISNISILESFVLNDLQFILSGNMVNVVDLSFVSDLIILNVIANVLNMGITSFAASRSFYDIVGVKVFVDRIKGISYIDKSRG